MADLATGNADGGNAAEVVKSLAAPKKEVDTRALARLWAYLRTVRVMMTNRVNTIARHQAARSTTNRGGC